uniref:Uncharacterized protein n=1 Tax=Panagrellus redivivus TaxID=6233 RepID=A0A7E4UMQ8_PANRE
MVLLLSRCQTISVTRSSSNEKHIHSDIQACAQTLETRALTQMMSIPWPSHDGILVFWGSFFLFFTS